MTYHPESTGHDQSPLSPGLAEYVTDAQLDTNAEAMPILQHKTTEDESRELAAIRIQLLQIPSIHVAPSQTEKTIRSQGLRPLAGQEAGARGHTLGVDRSLGLDEYVFMGWGIAAHPSGVGSSYGDTYVLVNAETLLDPKTIVTPADISMYVRQEEVGKSFSDLSPGLQATVQHHYFNGMLRGSDWLELTARRMWLHLQGNDGQPLPVDYTHGWGEVKFHGDVPPESIIDIVVDKPEPEAWMYNRHSVPQELGQSLIKRGCAIPPYITDIINGDSRTDYARKALAPADEVWRQVLDTATKP